jgi:hypothetical protein
LHEAILTALRHFEDAMQTDADILGVFYYGSNGRGTSDQFSDLDIRVWVVDAIEGAEAVSAKIRQLLGYCGEVHFTYGRDRWG